MVGILMALEMSSTFLLSKLKPFLIARLGIDGLFLLFAGVLLLEVLVGERFPRLLLLEVGHRARRDHELLALVLVEDVEGRGGSQRRFRVTGCFSDAK